MTTTNETEHTWSSLPTGEVQLAPPETLSGARSGPSQLTVYGVFTRESDSKSPEKQPTAAQSIMAMQMATGNGSGRENEFECDKCRRICKNQTALLAHVKVHTDSMTEKPHECKECGKAFMFEVHRAIHLRSHTYGTPDGPPECDEAWNGDSRGAVLQLECERTTQDRKAHSVVRSGEHPNKCDHCGKTFRFQSALAVHRRFHTGERPCRCDQCGKAFHQSSGLRMHMRRHVNKRAASGTSCGHVSVPPAPK